MDNKEFNKVFSDKLKKYMCAYNMTQAELAKRLGVGATSVYNWYNGVKTPRMDKVDKMCEIFHCKRSDLIEDKPTSYILSQAKLEAIDSIYTLSEADAAYVSGVLKANEIDGLFVSHPELQHVEKRRLPLLGTVACGQPIYANEDHETYIEVDADVKADFCVQAKGDSMINARIYDGDIVFVKRCSSVDNGDIAVVAIDDEVTLKRVYYYQDQQMLQLIAENPAYAPLVYTGEQLDHVRILGKAAFFQSIIR